MKLQDVRIGTAMELEVEWGEHKFQIPTHAIGANDDGLLIKPMTYNKQVIDLGAANDKDMVFTLYANDPVTDVRQAWRNLELKTILYKGYLYYAAKANRFKLDATTSERRIHNRMKLDVEGNLMLSGYEGEVQIQIIDLSDSGISFTTDDDIIVEKVPGVITFSDKVREQEFQIKLKCIKVRRGEYDGKSLWGCKVLETDKNMLAYICQKRAYIKANSEF